MSTAAPAKDIKEESSSSTQSTENPKKGEVSREVTTEVTADGMRIESNWSQVITSFDDMGLKEELLRGIYGYGFEKPSAIQQRGSEQQQLEDDNKRREKKIEENTAWVDIFHSTLVSCHGGPTPIGNLFFGPISDTSGPSLSTSWIGNFKAQLEPGWSSAV